MTSLLSGLRLTYICMFGDSHFLSGQMVFSFIE